MIRVQKLKVTRMGHTKAKMHRPCYRKEGIWKYQIKIKHKKLTDRAGRKKTDYRITKIQKNFGKAIRESENISVDTKKTISTLFSHIRPINDFPKQSLYKLTW